jgi:hypothetical protein
MERGLSVLVTGVGVSTVSQQDFCDACSPVGSRTMERRPCGSRVDVDLSTTLKQKLSRTRGSTAGRTVQRSTSVNRSSRNIRSAGNEQTCHVCIVGARSQMEWCVEFIVPCVRFCSGSQQAGGDF